MQHVESSPFDTETLDLGMLHQLQRYTQPFHTAEDEQKLLDSLRHEVAAQYKVGLVIGRFQPLHYGHIYLMKQALAISDTIMIGVGSANARNQDNPFRAHAREYMVRDALEKQGLAKRVSNIIFLNDYPDDGFWLQETLRQTGEVDVVVGNNGWVNGIFKGAHIPVFEVPLLERSTYQGSVIRQQLREEGILPRL